MGGETPFTLHPYLRISSVIACASHYLFIMFRSSTATSKWPLSSYPPSKPHSAPPSSHSIALTQIRAGSSVNWSITGRTINKKSTHARLDPPLHLAARRGGREGLQVKG